jgi:microcystin-dependent protein
MMWATATAPSGWIFCQGQSTSGYPALAAVVGATVPDMRGRVPVAPDAGAGRNTSFNALGQSAGSVSNTHQHFTTVGNDGNIYIALTGATVSGSTPASRVVSVNRSVIAGVGNGVAAMRQDATYDETIDIRQPFLNLNFIIKT